MISTVEDVLNQFKMYDEALLTFGNVAYPKFGNILLMAGGAGCHARCTEVLMFDGTYKAVEQIIVGDKLMGIDSSHRTVIELHTGNGEMLLVETSKNDFYISNIDHIHTFVGSFDKCGVKKNEIHNMTYSQFLSLPNSAKKALKIYKSNAITFPNDNYNFLNPWIIGFWLGYGNENTPFFTIENDSPLIDFITKTYQNDNYSFNKIKTDNPNCSTWSLTTYGEQNNPFKDYVIGKCQVDNIKRIPRDLLVSSIENRLSLLAGLIDSDGYAVGGGYELIVKDDNLKDDILFLVGSLGLSAMCTDKYTMLECERKRYNCINISGNELSSIPVVLDYKKITNASNKDKQRVGFSFKVLEKQDFFGFSIGEDDKRFILKNWIVNHNSGKGFVLSKLVGMEGKVMDVDALKTMAMASSKIVARVKDELGIDISKLQLKNKENVFKLHDIISNEIGLDSRFKAMIETTVGNADKDRLPNIIFDKTMKSLKHIKEVSLFAKTAGYDLKNVHIVWVVTDIEVAKEQNLNRSRTVPDEILTDTHTGVSSIMRYIINEIPSDIRNFIDGDIYITFNTAGIDSKFVKSKFGGSFLKTANYLKIKESGKPINQKMVTTKVIEKIKKYVPNPKNWD
jgi:hypothetical protein